MFMSFFSHLLSAWFAFLLPSYGTWKTLSNKPVSEPELERWAMYWCVMGAFVSLEYVAEWLVSWLPFYWELKTMLLLFLSLPQTQGFTWLYQSYLNPLLAKNEAEIDAGIASAHSNLLNFVQTQATKSWEALLRLMTHTTSLSTAQQNPNPAAQPAQSFLSSNPLEIGRKVWGAYGPSLTGMFGNGSLQPTPSTSGNERPHLSSSSSSNGAPSFPQPEHH